jgi:hypothetical protein
MTCVLGTAILIDAGGETNPLYNSGEALKLYLDDFFARRTDLNNTLQCVYLTHPHKTIHSACPYLDCSATRYIRRMNLFKG